MAIVIHDLALTFIWTEPMLDFLSDSPPETSMQFLGRRYKYAPAFEQAKKAQAKQGPPVSDPQGNPLEPPWPAPSGQRFWRFYLEMRTPGDITGLQAWRSLVPFRSKVPAEVGASWLPGRFVHEAFYYPHGLALAAKVRYRGPLTLQQAVALAFQVRRGRQFDVQWQGWYDDAVDAPSLDAFAEKSLRGMRRAALGRGAAPPAGTAGEPFTLCTVIRGEGVDPNVAVPTGTEVHRAFQAVTEWSNSYQSDQLRDLHDAQIQIDRQKPPGHVLYGSRRGRVVWFPYTFQHPAGAVSSLTCYHRNLMLATLQTASLCGFIEAIAHADFDLLPAAQSECARHVSGILGRLYGGRKTYRSWSPRLQIEQNDHVPAIDMARKKFGMEALS